MPLISIIMPVYNTAPYLKEAIESVLNQSEQDFEFIILNDASTDHSKAVIDNYTDRRIRIVNNEKNLGLASTLNKGIRLARGKYIARMDGDDICIQNRFEQQIAVLQKEEDKVVVCSICELIDENGKKIGNWKDDKKYLSPEQIKNQLPINNCIVHPSIIVTKEIISQFFYDPVQHESEDYDLWLRMSAKEIRFVKIPNTLILHRIRKESFTRQRQSNVYAKNFRVKLNFVYHQILCNNLNVFVFKTFFIALMDILFAGLKEIKKVYKNAISPFKP